MARSLPHRLTVGFLRGVVYLVAAILLTVALLLVVIQTGWAKGLIRALIVRQANHYLTGTLEIGSLTGSIVRGLALQNVRVTQNGETIVSVDEISLNYSIRELTESGVIIQRIALTRPRVIAARLSDGRWNLGALIKRESQEEQRRGPGRPLHIVSITVVDGDVTFRDPLTFGAVRVPTRYDGLNATMSFDYVPVDWTLRIAQASWKGNASSLTVEHLTGSLGPEHDAWVFNSLSIKTPKSAFTVNGRVQRGGRPTVLDLYVDAPAFAFQEWSTVVGGLRDIAIESRFRLSLRGPLTAIQTDIDLRSNGGGIKGALILDTQVEGWHGKGAVAADQVNLADWLSRPDRPSDVTGHVDFDLDLEIGHKLPKGAFRFDGPHAAYLGYQADNVRATGTVTSTEAVISDMTGTAYGSRLHITAGTIGIDDPYPYHLQGSDLDVDLRKIPETLPITRVESLLALDDFDVTGQFSRPHITGTARLGPSTYLGAAIGAGATGWIDTSSMPVRYRGEGDVDHLDIGRVGEALDVAWMKDPRWAGTVRGHFRAEGTSGEPAAITLDGGGRLARADMFGGHLTDADVEIHVANGSLTGVYNGELDGIDPALAFANPSFAATLSGTAHAQFAARDLLVRATTLADYTVDGSLDARDSDIRGFRITSGSLVGTLKDTTLDAQRVNVVGPKLEGSGSGIIELGGERSSKFGYDITRGDLSLADQMAGRPLSGTIETKGELTGPYGTFRVVGDATITDMAAADLTAQTTTGHYDVTMPWDEPERSTADLAFHATTIGGVDLLGQNISDVSGTMAYKDHRLDSDLDIGLAGCAPADAAAASPFACPGASLKPLKVEASVAFHAEDTGVDLLNATVTAGRLTWKLAETSPPPSIEWSDNGIKTAPLLFVDAAGGAQQLGVSGTWRIDGTGELRLTGNHLSLDTLLGEAGRPAPSGGTIDIDATLRGTRDAPQLSGSIDVTQGRVRKLTYDRLGVRFDYADEAAEIDLRLDQTSTTWLTAKGHVPLALVSPGHPERPLDLTVASSPVGLGLLEGLTDLIHNVTGQMTVNVHAAGTSRQPQLTGTIALTGAGFTVNSTGAHYQNGNGSFTLANDRVDIPDFRIEDRNRRTLTLKGSVGTHELAPTDLRIDAVARRFEVLHDEDGTVDVDGAISLRGTLEAPVLEGDITIVSGELKIDQILERTLFQPYATQATAAPAEIDAISALNPWDRLKIDMTVHSRGSLRLTGENVQVSEGTPLGLGSFNLRATGDIYLFKDPGHAFYMTGSFDSITGNYAFQGHRFEIDPTSSINFRGDLDPELYVTVKRVISGVEARVTISGTLHTPELHMASTPPLESSEILSLIVFNSTTNELNPAQQQELAVRAGTLAYGFVATPLVSALQQSLGLDTLEIAPPGATTGGPKVTVGGELVPGLVAQFTRQFGQEAGTYNEATIEYYLSRIFRIRATFSDAGEIIQQSPFRRVERAGIDFLIFLSF